MNAARRHPSYATAMFFIVGLILVAFLSPEANLVIPTVAGIALVLVTCVVNVRLRRLRE